MNISNNMVIKMKTHSCILICIGLMLCSCTSYMHSKPDYEKYADTITSRTIEKIHNETGLYPMGIGGGMMYGIRMMAISFRYDKVVDLDTARKLLVYSIEEYLKAINNDKRVRPYLNHYPFTAKGVEIRIFFYKPDGREVPPGQISCASAIKGILEYDTNNPDNYGFNRLHKETYADAMKIERKQNEPIK